MKILGNFFLKKMSIFWQFFDSQMAIFRRVRYGIILLPVVLIFLKSIRLVDKNVPGLTVISEVCILYVTLLRLHKIRKWEFAPKSENGVTCTQFLFVTICAYFGHICSIYVICYNTIYQHKLEIDVIYIELSVIYLYLYKYENVCLSVCSCFSRPFRNRLGNPLAQSCLLLLKVF